MRAAYLGTMLAVALTAGAASTNPVRAQGAPVYDWTGLYVGANVAYSWGNSDTTAATYNNTTGALLNTTAGSVDLDGWLAGVQIGHNWQNGRWVFGLEADLQWTGQDGDNRFSCPAAPGILGPCSSITFLPAGAVAPYSTFNQSIDWFATLRARIGWTVTPTILAYVTGGLAVGGISTDGTIVSLTGNGLTTVGIFGDDETNWGWTIGAGIEAVLSGNWTAKLEYLYIDFGSVSTVGFNLTSGPPLRVVFDSDIDDHILRVGLNYRFGRY